MPLLAASGVLPLDVRLLMKNRPPLFTLAGVALLGAAIAAFVVLPVNGCTEAPRAVQPRGPLAAA